MKKAPLLPIDPIQIIQKYYDPKSKVYEILVRHSESVAQKALAIVDAHPNWEVDRTFVYEAAMLHDIGINACKAPGIECYGNKPYILHGYIGAKRLRKEGLPLHALVCERHTGTGITLRQIISERLDLPHREMVPITLEEQIICFADKFYSKSKGMEEKSLEKIRSGLKRYSEESVEKFNAWVEIFLK